MPLKYSDFDPPSQQKWEEKLKKELKNEDLSAYDIDVNGMHVSPFTTLRIDNSIPNRTSNTYKIGARIWLEDEAKFNKSLKELLNYGLNAPIIVINHENLDFEIAFADIQFNYIFPIFEVDDSIILDQLNSFIISKETEQIGLLTSEANDLSSIESIYDYITGSDAEKEELISFWTSNALLQDIAQIRAIRSLQGQKKSMILGYIEFPMEEKYNPLIFLTIQSMSCILGGTDIIILPHEPSDVNMTRLGINIQHLCELESKLTLVDDPLKGSYLIEQMTGAMKKQSPRA